MDPVTALGVAAAALQFLDFGLQALSLCQQIRDDNGGATAANNELDAYLKGLRDLTKELESGTSTSNQAGRRITKIAKDCVATSDELFEVLKKVREAGSAKLVSAMKSTLRVMKERRTIERLQNTLKDRRSLLDSALIQDIRNRVDVAAISQSRQFSALESNLKRLITKLEADQTSMWQQHSEVTSQATVIETQSDELLQISVSGHGKTHHNLAKLHTNISGKFASIKFESAKEEILLSLFYPEHTSRREMLKPPWKDTFDWIFDIPKDLTRKQKDDLEWPSFAHWLRSSNSVYWISGKAGSGKSTLMAHIVNDHRTMQYLNEWADNGPLHIISFFFWRSGSRMQRSIQGLLRSLLYQLLDEVPGLAEEILKLFRLPAHRLPAWTESKLGRMIKAALERTTHLRICVFIDGLDEFDGDSNELVDVIFSLQDHMHVKFCVSSRPEIALSQRLTTCSHLRMEQLNYKDIYAFVSQKLKGSQYCEMLARKISLRARGVFLWAALATQSIISGIIAGDSKALLEERLSSVPDGMDTLYGQMLADVDFFHRKSLGFFFRIMELVAHPSIALIAAATLPGDISSYEDFWSWCVQVERQVKVQSQGLLEVGQIYNNQEEEHDHEFCHTWAASNSSILWNSSSLLRRCSVILTRSKTDNLDLVRIFNYYDHRKVKWLHRSAYDFVFDPNVTGIGGVLQLPPRDEVVTALVKGYTRLLIAAPYHDCKEDYSSFYTPTVQERRTTLIEFIGKSANACLISNLDDMLGELRHLSKFFDIEEMHKPNKYYYPSFGSETLNRLFITEGVLLCDCLRNGMLDYVQSNLTDIAYSEDSWWMLVLLLGQCCNEDENDKLLDPQMIEFLIGILTLLVEKISSYSITETQGCMLFNKTNFSSRSFFHVSWQPLGKSIHNTELERHLIEVLSSAWLHWSKYISQNTGCHSTKLFSGRLEEIFHLFSQLLELWKISIGVTDWKRFTRKGDIYITIQAPACSMSLVGEAFICEECIKLLAQDPSTNVKTPFRLMCMNSEVPGNGVIFEISPTISWYLLNRKERFLKRLISKAHFREELIADVRANSNGNLGAWQQLFLLACLRTLNLKEGLKFYGSIRPVTARRLVALKERVEVAEILMNTSQADIQEE